MLCNQNHKLQSKYFVEDVNFTKNDPCIFVVYPPGASGDLLISIIDKHYLKTGCEYYGIADNGRVMMYTTDYETIFHDTEFNEQWFWNLEENLGSRNLNYSILDQVIFGSHLYKDHQVQRILDNFPLAKIIRITPIDTNGNELLTWLWFSKLENTFNDLKLDNNKPIGNAIDSPQVLDLPFGFMFEESNYQKYYDQILDFLGLDGKLICFDYVKYYLSKQDKYIRDHLISYGKTICYK